MGAFLFLSGWVIRDNVFAYTPVDLYDNVWRLINNKFVDQSNNHQDWAKWRHKYDNQIHTNEDAYVAINTMVASLNDPYTKFLDPKEFADETSSIKGSLKGIGIQIGVKDGKLMVIAPIEDTPAERAGLQADDEILEIDGASTKGITVDKAADKIRGKEGTTVELEIIREGQTLNFTIERKSVELYPIEGKILDNNIGYIQISSFDDGCAEQFKEAYQEIQNKGIRSLIIDLRDNGGGIVDEAMEIADYILDKDTTMLITVDKKQEEEKE